jgi:hypothetical protein
MKKAVRAIVNDADSASEVMWVADGGSFQLALIPLMRPTLINPLPCR